MRATTGTLSTLDKHKQVAIVVNVSKGGGILVYPRVWRLFARPQVRVMSVLMLVVG